MRQINAIYQSLQEKINKFSIFQEKNSVAMKKYDYVKEPQHDGEGQGKSHFGTQNFTVGGQ